MTVEDQMRATLADLAPVAPADEHAYVGVRRAVTRRKRRRAARRVAAVTVVALTAAGVLAVGQRQDDTGVATDGLTAPRESFGAMTLELPAGWDVIDESTLNGADRMCVGPGDNSLPKYAGDISYPQYDDCSGLVLYHGDPLPGFEDAAYGEDSGNWSWYHRTDVAPCPDRPGAVDPIQQTDAGYQPVQSGEVVVGGRTAAHDRWEARCASGYTFSPQAWYLADEQVLIFDVVNRPEAQAIVDSIEWAGGG